MSTMTKNIFGAFLLILLSVSSGKTLRIADDLLDIHGYPTCEELRAFWNIVNQAKVISEYTNQIPAIPWDSSTHYQREHDHGYARQMLHSKDFLPRESLKSNRPSSADYTFFNPSPKSDDHAYGVSHQYGESHGGSSQDPLANEIIEGIVLSDPKRREESSEIRMNPWGNPYKVGLFGRFLDELPLQPEAKVSTNTNGKWSDNGQRLMENLKKGPCIQIENKVCASDLECMCSSESSRMRCHWRKCRFNIDKEENGYGTWLNGVLPRTQLGAYRKVN